MITTNYGLTQTKQPGFTGVGIHKSLKNTSIGKALGTVLKSAGNKEVDYMKKVANGAGVDVLIGETFLKGIKGTASKSIPVGDGKTGIGFHFKIMEKSGFSPVKSAESFLGTISGKFAELASKFN